MGYLSGARHDSQRGVEEVVETTFGVPLALGTVAAVEQEVSAVLAPAHAEAAAAVRQASAKNTDETGWKEAGRLCWLWTAVTAGAAFFVIRARRGAAGQAVELHAGDLGADRLADLLAAAGAVLARLRLLQGLLPAEEAEAAGVPADAP
jgi:hypothetical protein